MTPLLDNIAWHTLAGPQARHAIGTDTARRYAAGFPPIVAFASSDRPAVDALPAYCAPGEHLYCDGWSGAARAGWQMQRIEVPFLHVMSSNGAAHRLYERMGFRLFEASVARIVSRC